MILIFAFILFSNCQTRRNWAQLWVLPSENQSICLEKKEELTAFYYEAKEQCKEIDIKSQEDHANCSFYSRYRGVFCASETNYSKVMSMIPSDVKELEFYSYICPEEGYDLNNLKGRMIVNMNIASIKEEQTQSTPLNLKLVGDIKYHVSFLIANFPYHYLHSNTIKIINSDLNVENFYLQGAFFEKDSKMISVENFIVNHDTHVSLKLNNIKSLLSNVKQYSIFVGKESNGFQIRYYSANHWAPYHFFSSGDAHPLVNGALNNIPYDYANSFGILLTDCPKVSLWSENSNTQIKNTNVTLLHDFTITPRKPPFSKKTVKSEAKYKLSFEIDGNWPDYTGNPRLDISYDQETEIDHNGQALIIYDYRPQINNPYDINSNVHYGSTWSYKEPEPEKKKSNIGLIVGVTVAAVVVVAIIIVVVILVIRKRKANKSNSEQEEGAQQ